MSDTDTRLDRLESQLEQQAETIEAQRETIDAQRERIAELEAADSGTGETAETELSSPVGRRDALKAGGLLALLLGGVGTASADPQGQIGTSVDPLRTVYTEEINGGEINGGVTGDTAVTDLVGSGLHISGNTLEATAGSGLWEDAGDDGLLNPSDSGDTGIGVTDVRTDTLGDNGSFDVAMGSDLDFNGNTLTDSSGDLTLSALGNVAVSSAALDVQSGTVESTTGELTLSTGSGNLNLNPSADIDAKSNNVNNVSEMTATTASVGTLDNDGSAISVDDTLELNGNTASGVGGIDNNGSRIVLNDSLFVGSNSIASRDDIDFNFDEDADLVGKFIVRSAGTEYFRIRNSGPVQIPNSDLDLNGNNVRTSTGGLTVTTNDNGDLTLDPGTNNDLAASNVGSASSSDTLLARDGEDHVYKASKTVSDVDSYTGVTAYRGSDQSLSGESADTNIVVKFDTESFNLRTNYNTSTFSFIAPDNAFYSVDTQVIVNRTEANPYVVKLRKNSSDIPGARVRCTDTEATASLSLPISTARTASPTRWPMAPAGPTRRRS